MNDEQLIWEAYENSQTNEFPFKFFGSIEGSDRVEKKPIAGVDYLKKETTKKTEGLEPYPIQLTEYEKQLTEKLNLKPIYLYPVTYVLGDKTLNEWVYASDHEGSLQAFILTRYIDMYEDSFGEVDSEVFILDTQTFKVERETLGGLYNYWMR
jgi:hypothetical protein